MWHGSSLSELLAGVDYKQAAARPIANAHSIWELVLHIAVWTDVARRRVLGERVEPTAAEDWPAPVELNEAGWLRDCEMIHTSHEALAEVVGKVPTSKIDARVKGYEYTVRTLIHGVIEHDCYHGGQIALLKKSRP